MTALQALDRFAALEGILAHRAELVEAHRASLGAFAFQQLRGRRQAHQFFPARLEQGGRGRRDALVKAAAAEGIELRAYFSPPVAPSPPGRCNLSP